MSLISSLYQRCLLETPPKVTERYRLRRLLVSTGLEAEPLLRQEQWSSLQ